MDFLRLYNLFLTRIFMSSPTKMPAFLYSSIILWYTWDKDAPTGPISVICLSKILIFSFSKWLGLQVWVFNILKTLLLFVKIEPGQYFLLTQRQSKFDLMSFCLWYRYPLCSADSPPRFVLTKIISSPTFWKSPVIICYIINTIKN